MPKATFSEVKAGKIRDKYVLPFTLNGLSPILLTEQINADGTKESSFGKKSFTSRRINTGHYRIDHNLGEFYYGLIGSGIDAGTIKVGIKKWDMDYCEVYVSDDSSTNDASFSFQIFRTQ